MFLFWPQIIPIHKLTLFTCFYMFFSSLFSYMFAEIKSFFDFVHIVFFLSKNGLKEKRTHLTNCFRFHLHKCINDRRRLEWLGYLIYGQFPVNRSLSTQNIFRPLFRFVSLILISHPNYVFHCILSACVYSFAMTRSITNRIDSNFSLFKCILNC